MTSSQPSWHTVGDVYRRQMTSVPVDSARAQSSLSLLYPVRSEVYGGDEDGRRQVVLVVAVPLQPQLPNDAADDDVVVPRDVEDLMTPATRCSDSELHVDDEDDRAHESAVATARLSPRNPVFGTSKSPKSYWLRRHSDSVFAGADRDLEQRADEPAASPELAARRHYKERTVSDSRSTAKAFDLTAWSPLDDRKPLARRFQSTVVGMQCSGESDDVFAEAAAFQSATPRDEDVDTELRGCEEPSTNYWQLERSSVQCGRCRVTVTSAGDLDDIDEENQSRAGDGDTSADSSTLAKFEVSEPPSSDGVTSMELSGDPLWQHSEEAADHIGDDNGQREVARPEASSARAAVRRRGPRVVWPSRQPASVESTFGCDSTSSDGRKIHRCAECRRTFSRSDMLERHVRLHTGVRPYACRLCTQVFSRSDHLTTHLRTHTGEKPYACPRCAYTASRRDMVTRHLRVHQSAPAVDPAVTGVLGPPRRRIYRSRYKERWTRTGVDRPDVEPSTGSSPTERQSALLDEGTRYVQRTVDGQHLGAALSWSGSQRRDAPLPSPSPPSSESVYRRRLEHFQTLHALSRSVVARGSTGSSDSYSSPGCLSASDVFEFALGGGSGVEGSPDVFRSPSSARQSSVFLFPYTTASAALSVCDSADSF